MVKLPFLYGCLATPLLIGVCWADLQYSFRIPRLPQYATHASHEPRIRLSLPHPLCAAYNDAKQGLKPKSSDFRFWTHLIFLHADNNLESSAVMDLREMLSERVFLDESHMHLVVLVDRSDRHSSETVSPMESCPGVKGEKSGDFSGAYVLTRILRDGRLIWLLLDSMGEIDMNSSEILAGFVTTGFTAFPSIHTALTLWNHGSSWGGMGDDETNSDGRPMSLSDIYSGVKHGLDRVQIRSSQTHGHVNNSFDLDDWRSLDRKSILSVLGFDACLMASYEVIQMFVPLAHFIIASEENEPGYGWDYRRLRPSSPSSQGVVRASTAFEYGVQILEGYTEQQRYWRQSSYTPLTLAVVESARFELFRASFETLLDTLLLCGGRDVSRLVTRAVSTAGPITGCGMIGLCVCVDVGAFLGAFTSILAANNFSPNSSMNSLIKMAIDVRLLYDKAIVAFTKPSQDPTLSGLQIFYPLAPDNMVACGDTGLAKSLHRMYFRRIQSKWSSFVGKMIANQAGSVCYEHAPSPLLDGQNENGHFDDDKLEISSARVLKTNTELIVSVVASSSALSFSGFNAIRCVDIPSMECRGLVLASTFPAPNTPTADKNRRIQVLSKSLLNNPLWSLSDGLDMLFVIHLHSEYISPVRLFTKKPGTELSDVSLSAFLRVRAGAETMENPVLYVREHGTVSEWPEQREAWLVPVMRILESQTISTVTRNGTVFRWEKNLRFVRRSLSNATVVTGVVIDGENGEKLVWSAAMGPPCHSHDGVCEVGCNDPIDCRLLAVSPTTPDDGLETCASSTCDTNAYCDPQGREGYTCVCRHGFQGDGERCIDTNECLDPAACPTASTCVNYDGGHRCEPDFVHISCPSPSPCPEGLHCLTSSDGTVQPKPNANGVIGCGCAEGWVENGGTCEDIDECSVGLASCSPQASCVNIGGSYLCSCPAPSFEGDGLVCVKAPAKVRVVLLTHSLEGNISWVGIVVGLSRGLKIDPCRILVKEISLLSKSTRRIDFTFRERLGWWRRRYFKWKLVKLGKREERRDIVDELLRDQGESNGPSSTELLTALGQQLSDPNSDLRKPKSSGNNLTDQSRREFSRILGDQAVVERYVVERARRLPSWAAVQDWMLRLMPSKIRSIWPDRQLLIMELIVAAMLLFSLCCCCQKVCCCCSKHGLQEK